METMKSHLAGNIPLVRAMPEPPGLYIRARREDKTPLLELFASGTTNLSGIVFDPSRVRQDKELREVVLRRYLDAVLEPKTQQLATPYGYTKALASLPWGGGTVHTPDDFVGSGGRKRIGMLADFALVHGYTAIVAPTHLVRNSDDPWFAVDVDSTKRLRDELDRRRGSKVAIFYGLALPYSTLRDQDERDTLVHSLDGLPIDQLWLKTDGLGSAATPAGVANYLDACTDFHELEIPIIADHFGGYPGLALVAMGGVTGICHGVTVAEQFDSSPWLKERSGDIYSLRTRAYIQRLDLNLDVKLAKSVIERDPKTRALFACHDRHCCERDATDMLQKPGKHFIFQRMQQISTLGRTPRSLRPYEFVQNELRRLTENLVKATNLNVGDELLAKRLVVQRKRLDGLRTMLTKRISKPSSESTAVSLATRRAREAGIR